ncbi:MAG: hypothetical protein ABSC54_05770 [Smithellaceae bacterium]|jgi:hypothetical protein
MKDLDTLKRLGAADGFRETVLSVRKGLKEVKQTAHNAATSYVTARQTLDAAAFHLRELKSGRGALLAQISGASIYEFWFEFVGYSGPAKGASARLTQHGVIQQVSNVTGKTKGGLGGAAVGGLVFGPAGAIVGAVARRKTIVKTNVQTVDNRTFELELTVPGFAWSTIAGPEAEAAFRMFRDIVNARGTSSDDIKAFIAKQEDFVRRKQEIAGAAGDALKSSDELVLQGKASYDAMWDKYMALRLPVLLDLRARWDRSGLLLRLITITLGPLMMLAWVVCFLLSVISSAPVPGELAPTIVSLWAAILVGAAIFYIIKVRLLK